MKQAKGGPIGPVGATGASGPLPTASGPLPEPWDAWAPGPAPWHKRMFGAKAGWWRFTMPDQGPDGKWIKRHWVFQTNAERARAILAERYDPDHTKSSDAAQQAPSVNYAMQDAIYANHRTTP